jgi:hypothetical protein
MCCHLFLCAKENAEQLQRGLSMISNILSQAASIHNAATWAMQNTDWEFMAVYHDAVDHFCHGFMKYHPPQRKGIPDKVYEMFKDVVGSAYRYHDMMLQRMIDLAGKDTTVLVISDHGFHSDHLRPNKLPKEPAGPAHEHSQFGIFCLTGPGILKDERVYGATLLDIAPTLLTLFGLPVGKDMDGKPLVQVLEEREPDYIESWKGCRRQWHASRQYSEDPWAPGSDGPIDRLVRGRSVLTEESDGKYKAGINFYLSRILMYRKQYDKAPNCEKVFQKISRYGTVCH